MLPLKYLLNISFFIVTLRTPHLQYDYMNKNVY